MDSQDTFNDHQSAWNQQAFHQIGPWPGANNGTSAQAFRPEFDSFSHQGQQSSAVMVPSVPLFSPSTHSQMMYASVPSILPSSSDMRAQSDVPPSKVPNFAKLLQYQAPVGSQVNPDTEARPGQTRRPRGRAQHRINPKDWEKYKTYIKKLYLEKGKTVSEIMIDMSECFGFTASEQMYKNKLSDWGFSKYMPKDLPTGLTQWVAFKIDERKLVGKDTEFVYNDRVLPIDRIQQTAKRTKHHQNTVPFDKATPLGLDYYTPSSHDHLPSPFHIGIASPLTSTGAQNRWKPSSNTPLSKNNHLRVAWKGFNLPDLEAMRRDAKPLCESGRLEEAEQKLRDSLEGYEYLLTSTNECTLTVAYELAEFYSENGRMNDADAVLQWMGDELVKGCGLNHQKTISHMLHVVGLYQQWSRTNDAVTILLRAMDSIDSSLDTQRDLDNISEGRSKEKITAKTSDTSKINRNFTFSRVIDVSEGNGQKDADGNLEFQLSIAKARTRANDPETEPLLLRLVEECDKLPDQFNGLVLKSRGALIDLYIELGKGQELDSALEISKERFFAIMKQKLPKSLSLLDAGVDLSSMFVKASRYKEADAMFSEVERELTNTQGEDDCDNSIDILIDIGMLYQGYNRWNDARARFEHALALTISSRGPECRLARKLQAALDNRNFSLGSLQELEYKSSLRRRLMEF